MAMPLPEAGPREWVLKVAVFERKHESLAAMLVLRINVLDAWAASSDRGEERRLVLKFLHQSINGGDIGIGNGAVEIKGHMNSNLRIDFYTNPGCTSIRGAHASILTCSNTVS